MNILGNIHTSKRTLFCAATVYFTYKIFTHLKTDRKYIIYTRKSLQFVKKLVGIQEPDEMIDCDFFGTENADCRKHLTTNLPCLMPYCSHKKLQKLLNFLKSATKTIDLCMYLLTSREVGDTLISLHNNGIKVRVIVEEEMSTSSESQVQLLIHAGIVVRSKKLPALMHHKFCLIDAEYRDNCQILTGSLNWTLQGLAGNSEYIVMTNNKRVIRTFYEDFNEIWNYFDIKEKKPIILKNRKTSRNHFYLNKTINNK